METRFVPEDCCFIEVSVPPGMDALLVQLDFGRGADALAEPVHRDMRRLRNWIPGRIGVLRPGFIPPSGCPDC